MKGYIRPNSVVVVGGAFGDEGKGRIVDELVAYYLKTNNKVIQYRDNGGANAGHTVSFKDTKIALHQLGSGILHSKCIVISGKEMVLHPQDLVHELELVAKTIKKKITNYKIDEKALLCLDTHRAFENILKLNSSGSLGSTGRGISPAYADFVLRHPIRVRDLYKKNWEKLLKTHYEFYQKLINGFGFELKNIKVIHSNGEQLVGNYNDFLKQIEFSKNYIKPYVTDVFDILNKYWTSNSAFVFEKAQAIGLDSRHGAYPDVTASDCTPAGVFSSTEGIIDPNQIEYKVAVIKATYTSSVGIRQLPSSNHHLTAKIREDAHEYGATTGRPRDIHYLDIPALSYFMRVGGIEYLSPTHLDICYPDEPIKIVENYTLNGKIVPYRPDQEYLNLLKPKFAFFPSWDGKSLVTAKKPQDLPKNCRAYLKYLCKSLNVKLLLATTGPKRHQTISWMK